MVELTVVPQVDAYLDLLVVIIDVADARAIKVAAVTEPRLAPVKPFLLQFCLLLLLLLLFWHCFDTFIIFHSCKNKNYNSELINHD